MIEKALCRLCASGARFHTKFADALCALGFVPTYADPDIWKCDIGDCHDCVVAHVNDSLTVLKDPDSFCKKSQSDPWNHKLKDIEEWKCHLGDHFFHDEDGTLFHGTQTCMRHFVDTDDLLFGE